MFNKAFFLGATALGLAIGTQPVAAAPFLFELSGSRSAIFQIDPATTTPDFFSDTFIGTQISYNTVAGTFGGVDGTATIGFGTNLAAALNVQSPNLGFTQFVGPPLFTLVNAQPVFNLGTFQLTSIVSGASTIRISAVAVAAPVPEPLTWTMMTVGFGVAGAMIRRRRRATTFA